MQIAIKKCKLISLLDFSSKTPYALLHEIDLFIPWEVAEIELNTKTFV